MATKAEANASGIGFFGLLAILFIGLKLTDVIDWSWWWVLAPLWGPAALVITILIGAFVIWVIAETKKKKR